ncbi:MAG: Hsp70 family protein, partial [Pseudomonadota bacterium]|nr:Hsp70 family protein [Pseudomonadota bacterium]
CLSFMTDPQLGAAALKVEAGTAAIWAFINNPGDCRFLQSIKTFAASRQFSSTHVHGRRQRFEDLMEIFTRRMMFYAGDGWPGDIERIVVGRPVRFAGASPDEELAVARYTEALSRFGFPQVRLVLEPVAAAHYFAQTLDSDTAVLVADFGGGTTDYSIILFEWHAGRIKANPLAHAGVGVAGDMFDYRIIDRVVSPLVGKGSHYRSFGKRLAVPASYYANFARWNQLSIFRTLPDFAELEKLVRLSEEPAKLERFVDLIENDEGYPLYQAVSRTKFALSDAEEAEFHFPPLGDDCRRLVRRSEFETWIAPDLARMAAALDEVLAAANMDEREIGKVFLTGGTSFVPAVRTLFENRFDVHRVESGGELLSIAHGLALIGDQDEGGQWLG